MEPPVLPAPKPPLGAHLYILLLTPLALMAISFCCLNQTFGGAILAISGLSVFVCSILLATALARRSSTPGKANAGLGILFFFGLLTFYGVCFFIGCTTATFLA